MQAERTAHQSTTSPLAAWTLAGEQSITGPFASDAVEQAVVELLPPGPEIPLFNRSLIDNVVTAVLYMQYRRGTRRVCLQCYQLCSDVPPVMPACSLPPLTAKCRCAPAIPCGWSYFLIEKTLEDDQAVIQVYLFHE